MTSFKRSLWLVAVVLCLTQPLAAQEWTHWGADSRSSRYSPADQINRENFEDLEVAWVWRGDNFGPSVDYILRATPIYVDGKLYTVAGQRRTVVAIEPATGETLWTFREPTTKRWEYSMRKNYGKGVAFSEVDGQGRIYLVSPAFNLHALHANNGRPVEQFGNEGMVDILDDFGYPHDPNLGIPLETGYVTSSSPAIVVNGVIVIGNTHQQGYYQTRRENVPGHIMAYDAKTGEFLWKFNIIPQPGEFGHDTWENDAWSYTGNVSTWAPLSADPELGLVYFATDPPTNDFYGGFHPGANLFSTTIMAVDVKTGKRAWHFQTVHHDIWNYDNPTAPTLVDITQNGEKIPVLVQTTKQAFAYVLNRKTGEPIWPIEERPVPQTTVPGEKTSPTQPFPTKPAAYDKQGLTEDDLIDFTPELRAEAVEVIKKFKTGPLFNPPLHRDNSDGYVGSLHCPGGATNIMGGAAVDPETAILYVASVAGCSSPNLVPGEEMDDPDKEFKTGKTVMRWVSGPRAFGRMSVQGLSILKPPYGKITAIDLNTGEHLWWIPNGDTPDFVKNHKALQGVDIGNTGQRAHATALVTKTLLMYGEGRNGEPRFHAVNKKTSEHIGVVDIPAPTNQAPMSYVHDGKQYIVVAIASNTHPGSLVALALAEE